MASDELIGGHVSLAQSKKAISALLQYVRKEQQRLDETELLPSKEQHVWLIVTVKRMQPTKKLKPHKIPLVHPLVDPRASSVCLITKDPQREYKDLLEAHGIKFISRVLGVQKLRGKFKGFDARRQLLRENGLFLADERVIPLLPGLLGKKWFEAKKQPIPVSLTKKSLKVELENAISSTYMHQNQGTCTSIKIAKMSQKDSQVFENLSVALPAVVASIHGGWDNVQSFNIKTSDSVSLPIWTCPLGSSQPGSRWEGMGIDENEWTGFGAEVSNVGDSEHVAEAVVDEMSKTKGKKRGIDAEDTQSHSKKKTSVDSTVPTDSLCSRQKKSRAVAEGIGPSRGRSHKPDTKSTPSTATDATKMPVKKPKTRQPQSSTTEAIHKSLARGELLEKKSALEGGQFAKKKSKLRETEKSAKKSVKAGIVGRIKA